MYIGNGRETTTATVLYSLKIKKGGKNEIYRGLARNGDEHGKNRKKPYCRSVLRVAKTYRCWKGAEVAAVCLVTSG